MCGIAGIFLRNGDTVGEQPLQAMTTCLAHRGPDGDGFFRRGPVGLGHRRLAIIDLVTGDQPMSSEDAAVTVVFNGEIYNFRELRREMEARGWRFRTASDTEVILRAYEEYGVDCLRHLRGMFAFAIWDERRQRLFLARDRVGIKPLVYAWDGQRLLFASEPKAILEDRSVPRRIDWEALRDYLTLHYIPSPRTIFAGIRKLPPGCFLTVGLDGGEPTVQRYWDLRFEPDVRRSEAEWLEGLRAHLHDAVSSHLVSDVPIGAFLSGGMDSGTVVALMAGATRGHVRTFAIGFDEASHDELAHARRVAQHHGTQHFEFVVKPDALEVLPKLVWQFDEPFADSSAIPTYFVSKITREHVTVALSGDGGDENFLGYSRYVRALALHDRLDRFPGVLARSLFRWAARLSPDTLRGHGYLEMLGSDPVARYFRLMAFQRSEGLRRILSADARQQVSPCVTPRLFDTLSAAAGAPDYASTLQSIDVRCYLPEDILTKVDKASMLVSLESRVPLLDHVLMEFVATMPTRLKFQNGAGKAILKKAMADRLPPETLNRRKMGFGVPLGEWFRRDLGAYTREVLEGRRTRERGLLDPRAVSAVLDEHQSGARDRSSQIWALLCLEEWARRWLDR
ncbi:MAG TPA: asparagine synthase (glutamine-hydrolyzing) [Methylomirabilota bacterium]|jgi:asparagine synthase (glutamine-hydrolysing)